MRAGEIAVLEKILRRDDLSEQEAAAAGSALAHEQRELLVEQAREALRDGRPGRSPSCARRGCSARRKASAAARRDCSRPSRRGRQGPSSVAGAARRRPAFCSRRPGRAGRAAAGVTSGTDRASRATAISGEARRSPRRRASGQRRSPAGSGAAEEGHLGAVGEAGTQLRGDVASSVPCSLPAQLGGHEVGDRTGDIHRRPCGHQVYGCST